jgi:hypothetical protein
MTILDADFCGVLPKTGECHMGQEGAWHQEAVINPEPTDDDR